ncbi:MAG: SDR family oxidoreductase [Thaumarchaeota archaeon]|nr:SDR family oxidoreductase [Nitrososphaerota archaeon]
MQIDLTGKVGLVTGAGRGIGKAIAVAMARAGADMIPVDVDINTLKGTTVEISQLGRKSTGFQVEVSRLREVEDVVSKAVGFQGKIDILVNNAGVVIRKPMEEYSEADWDSVINTNLKGTFNFSQAVGRQMVKQGTGGRIINISSIFGLVALPPRASYSASKGAIVSLTRDLAAEWAKHKITVNAICPGWTKTEMTANYFAQEDVSKFLLERIPLGRFAEPEEIANLAMFLASDYSSYITGQGIPVDGGWTAL